MEEVTFELCPEKMKKRGAFVVLYLWKGRECRTNSGNSRVPAHRAQPVATKCASSLPGRPMPQGRFEPPVGKSPVYTIFFTETHTKLFEVT